MTEDRGQHFSGCGHAILADSMGVELQRQFEITVAKQSLYSFWIGSNADQKRRQTMAEIVKPELSWVVIDELSSFIRVR